MSIRKCFFFNEGFPYIFLKEEKKKNYVIAEVPNQTHNEIDFVYEMNPSFENRSYISKCL